MLSVLVLAASTCVAPSSNELVGFWESRRTSQGGIGHALEFRRDGTAVASTTVIVNLFYRVVKDRVFVGEAPDPLKQSDSGFQVDRDTLIETGSDSKSVRKERFGVRESKGDSIVGTWRYPHYTGGTAYERFTDDGRLLFRLPMTAYVGCYAVSGDKLSMTEPHVTTTRFDLRTDDLLLMREDKDPLEYRRVSGGPWYPRAPTEINKQMPNGPESTGAKSPAP